MRNLIINTSGRVTPECSRSHLACRFFVARPGGRLFIEFNYGPKNLEDQTKAKSLIEQSIELCYEADHKELARAGWESFLPLKNLITLSVDDPNGHRGAAHRHDEQQLLFLSDRQASPGLVSGEVTAGMWEVTLSLHAIVTDFCDYSLQIWQEEVAL